jgi:hypothetical protein
MGPVEIASACGASDPFAHCNGAPSNASRAARGGQLPFFEATAGRPFAATTKNKMNSLRSTEFLLFAMVWRMTTQRLWQRGQRCNDVGCDDLAVPVPPKEEADRSDRGHRPITQFSGFELPTSESRQRLLVGLRVQRLKDLRHADIAFVADDNSRADLSQIFRVHKRGIGLRLGLDLCSPGRRTLCRAVAFIFGTHRRSDQQEQEPTPSLPEHGANCNAGRQDSKILVTSTQLLSATG